MFVRGIPIWHDRFQQNQSDNCGSLFKRCGCRKSDNMSLSWNIWFQRLWNQTPCVFDWVRGFQGVYPVQALVHSIFLYFFKPSPKEKGKIRAETARIVFAAVRRKPVSEPIDFLSRDGRRRCRRRRQTLGNTLKMIVAESVQLEALGWNTPFSTASKQKKSWWLCPYSLPSPRWVALVRLETLFSDHCQKKWDMRVSQVEFRIWGILLV